MSTKILDKAGLEYLWTKLKAYFAPKAHTHNAFETKHSYTVAANAAKNWYRIANANTSQIDTANPIHGQFILTAYNVSYDTGYYQRWFVNAEVFGRTAHIVIFGNTSAPFSQARILYENTIADLDANDRPAIDIYLNYVLPNGTTKIEIEEVYNSGWTFLADGQLVASTVPSGFENVACSVRNNGVERSTYADYVSYLNRQISNITAAFTLADNWLYRSRTLNCTGTFTITIPSINSGYMWCVIKNKNASSGVITLHPSTTSVLIDGSNADITLQPMEYVCIHSAGANNYSLIADGRWKSQKADDNAVIHLAGAETITGAKTFSSEVKISSVNALRIKSSNYGAFFRNDNNVFYLLVTASGDADGTWTTARPLTVNLSDGKCSINGNAATASAVAWSGVTSKPTTIAGYGITDAKIANGTITLGSSTITPLTSGSTLDATKLSGTASIDTTGNAGTATKLTTSRTISLTGDVSGSASFDGSANASITATVADDSHNHVISNVDGLQDALDAKAADSAVVHLTENETISGIKTFSSNAIFSGELRRVNATTAFVIRGGSGVSNGATFHLCGESYPSLPGYFRLYARTSSNQVMLEGRPDGTLTWNGNAIQTSSDERLKTALAFVPDEVLDAWEAVGWGQFQFLDAVERKGEAARLHLGLIAQHVKAVFEARGLDACQYGILCHEEHGDTVDEPAVDVWMVRYTEALAMEAAYQRRKANRLEARIAILEAKLL